MRYKLFYFFSAVLFIAGNAYAQKTGFSIKGSFDSTFAADSVFIYNEEGRILSGAPVADRKFELKGSVSEPHNVMIIVVVDKEKYVKGKLILENADYTYTFKNTKIVIKGGLIHDLVLGFESSDEYYNAVGAYTTLEEKIFADENKGPDDITPEEKKQLNEAMSAVVSIESRNLNSIIKNPKAPVLAKVFAVSRTQEWEKYPAEKRIALFKEYEKELGGSKLIAKLRADWERILDDEKMQESVGEGKMFKDIEAVDVNGNVVKLSDVIAKNKCTLLEFWASWCGPCRGEIPVLKEAYAKYKSKGLEIYSISLDNEHDKWLKALQQENTAWVNVIDPAAFKGNAAKGYGISGIPASFLIGQDGRILVSDEKLRGKELEQTLSRYMP